MPGDEIMLFFFLYLFLTLSQCEERGFDCSDTTCVNYTSKTECTASRCGADCKNQRFQKKEWIEISLVKRGRMGYGARAEQDVQKGQFVMEYVGEGMCQHGVVVVFIRSFSSDGFQSLMRKKSMRGSQREGLAITTQWRWEELASILTPVATEILRVS